MGGSCELPESPKSISERFSLRAGLSPLTLWDFRFLRPVEPVMVYRPRTKAKIAKRQKRCSKCNALVSYRSRCKKCHKVVS